MTQVTANAVEDSCCKQAIALIIAHRSMVWVPRDSSSEEVYAAADAAREIIGQP